MLNVLASLGIVATVGTLLSAAVAAIRRLTVLVGAISGLSAAVERSVTGGEKSIRQELRDLQDLVDRLPQRWEDIRRESARLDARARSTVARVRAELAESGLTHERVETLADELQLEHGDGSDGGELRPVRGEVAPVPAVAAPLPGSDEDWREKTRRLKWGA